LLQLKGESFNLLNLQICHPCTSVNLLLNVVNITFHLSVTGGTLYWSSGPT